MRSYEDGSHIRLATHIGWLEYYYQNNFHHHANKIPEHNGTLPWSCLQDHLAFHKACEIFDLANSAVVVMHAGNTVERYSLGSTRENRNVNHIYLHHPDLFYKFILYFKDKAFELIKKAQQMPILPSINAADPQPKDFSIDNFLLKNFLDMIDVKNVSIVINNQDIRLPKKEIQILALMKQGLTTKEISKEMNLKKRTIDAYCSKIKERLNQHTKNTLFKQINKNSLIDINFLFK